ncbi:MAG: response regulator transcription factor [Synechococcaceae cyanobacterium SM2_3_1]|nr:response regulator transcription factor [Synechococcaceae cyanobacterium SM2_3_1]
MPAPIILVIEDDPALLQAIQQHIQREGFTCVTAETQATGLKVLDRMQPDLVVLDLMLPDGDGFQLCQQLRSRQDYVPLLMLTARATEEDRIHGLTLGADDYMTKPFSAKELTTRIHSLLRRAYAPGYCEVSRGRGLQMDRDQRKAFLHGEPLDLRGKEFDVLALMSGSPGRAYTREQLLEQVWGYDYEGEARIVDVYIRKLREKIEQDPAHPQYLQTVWGVGYRFQEPQ